MPRFVLSLGILLLAIASSSPSFSRGAVAYCPSDPKLFSITSNQTEPGAVALKYFEDHYGVFACAKEKQLIFFSDTCIVLALTPPRGLPQEQELQTFTDRTRADAQLKALRTCGATCTILTSLCDSENIGSANRSEPSVSRNVPAVPSSPGPSGPSTTNYPDSLDLPVQNVQTRFHINVQSFPDIEEIQNVALIAATLTICVLVLSQLVSLIRTGRRRPRDFLFQALCGVAFVIVGTCGWFVALYTTKTLIAFAGTLSLAGKMLLATIAIGCVLLALPYSFWRMLGDICFAWPQQSEDRQRSPPNTTDAVDDIRSPESTEAMNSPITSQRPVVQQPVETIQVSPDTSPQEPFVLRLKRSQKSGFRNTTIYMLDARIDVNAEIRSLIEKHKLGKKVIYESDARQRHAANARDRLDDSRTDTPFFASPSAQATGFGRSLWQLTKASVNIVRASLALQVTVSSLMAGVHVECKSMDELLEAEDAIRAAKRNLEGYIGEIVKFDGTEEIVV